VKNARKTIPSQVKVKKKKFTQGLPIYNHHAAGIDIGDTNHAVAIEDEKGGFEVREYQAFTVDLAAIVAWLVSVGITTVAIESTGIYWLNLYLMLEEAGIEPYLVNAKHVKNVTGRKKDDTDAIWLQKLHSCGLLQKSFQPESSMRELRTYVRQRKNLIRISSDSVRRMQKAMELMNIKLHTVISDILGKTGLKMVTAIIAGERDVDELIKFKDSRIMADDEDIKKSLQGIWRDEYLFMLKQAYDEYMFYQSQQRACDEKIKDVLLAQTAEILQGDITDIELIRKGKPKKNQLSFDAQSMLKVIVGVDLCQVEGIAENSALELISEIGTDMSKWKNSKYFSAWLNVAPNTKITGGKIISSKMQKKKNYAGQTLRMSASNLSRSKTPIGDFARKMKSRLGKKGGVVATAHKMARIIYTMIKEQKEYNKDLMVKEQENWKRRRIKYLENQLDQLKKMA
jgi:transposase